VLDYAKRHGIPFQELIDFTVQLAEKRKKSRRYPKACINYTRLIVERLFLLRGSNRDFRDAITLKIRTGNVQEVVDYIRHRLYVPGLLGHIVPATRTLRTSAFYIKKCFSVLLRPEITFSGFRCDLLTYVRLTAHLLLQKDDIIDLQVDIWGDACEIGGKEVTRFVFRFLTTLPLNISAQSTNATFCFAAFYGKDSRFALEANMGWAILGCQETGWLYKQTCSLHEAGAIVSYSGDTPFLLRVVTGNASDDVHSSRMALHIDPDAKFLPTAVDEITGERIPAKVPFRKENPPQSLIFLKHVAQVCPDITHMMIRLVEFDLKKMAQLVLNTLHPYTDLPIQALESNLTDRQIKAPFEFTVDKRGKTLCITLQHLR
jgi:hypothetical protein